MGRNPCCYKQKLRKGLWSPEEDEKLFNHIIGFGVGCWSSVPKQAGLQRCGKSCRLRWINYLRPDLKRGSFSQQEEDIIIGLHQSLGNRWSKIAANLPGRTDNEVKNFWNSCLKKKLREWGIDPSTHKPLKEIEVKEVKHYSNDLKFSRSLMKPIFDPFPLFEFEAGLNPMETSSNIYNQLQQNFRPSNQNDLVMCSDFDLCSIPSSGFSDHGDVLDVSDNYHSEESNWNCNIGGAHMNNDMENEVLNWASESKLESLIQMQMKEMRPHEHKLNPWQNGQHNFENLEENNSFLLSSLSQDLTEACFDITRGKLACDFNRDLH